LLRRVEKSCEKRALDAVTSSMAYMSLCGTLKSAHADAERQLDMQSSPADDPSLASLFQRVRLPVWVETIVLMGCCELRKLVSWCSTWRKKRAPRNSLSRYSQITIACWWTSQAPDHYAPCQLHQNERKAFDQVQKALEKYQKEQEEITRAEREALEREELARAKAEEARREAQVRRQRLLV
jgi:hypothetical protein